MFSETLLGEYFRQTDVVAKVIVGWLVVMGDGSVSSGFVSHRFWNPGDTFAHQ